MKTKFLIFIAIVTTALTSCEYNTRIVNPPNSSYYNYLGSGMTFDQYILNSPYDYSTCPHFGINDFPINFSMFANINPNWQVGFIYGEDHKNHYCQYDGNGGVHPLGYNGSAANQGTVYQNNNGNYTQYAGNNQVAYAHQFAPNGNPQMNAPGEAVRQNSQFSNGQFTNGQQHMNTPGEAGVHQNTSQGNQNFYNRPQQQVQQPQQFQQPYSFAPQQPHFNGSPAGGGGNGGRRMGR